jgi:IS1 family transposase
VVAQIIEERDRKTMRDFVRATVSDRVSLVATDQHRGYDRLDRGFPRERGSRQGEYVRGSVHTANLDSFWSLLKRGIMGTFHKVSADYLPLYLNEFSFRHNHRKDPDMFGALVTTCS